MGRWRASATGLVVASLILAFSPLHAAPLFGHAEYPAGFEPRSVAVADFNADSAPDLVVGADGGDTIAVLLNRGDGLFQPPDFYRAGADPRQVAVGDMDLDGDIDVIAAAFTARSVTVLENNGDGSFNDLDDGAVSRATSDSPVDVEVGPLDGDGFPDVLVAAFPNELFINDGGGGLASGVAPGGGGLGLDLADLDGDADLDYVIGFERLTAYENDGSGGFSEIGAFDADPRDSSHVELALGDLDGDGDPDVATGNFTLAAVGVAFNNGDGSFGGAVQIDVGGSPSQVAMTDLDGDGDKDLAAVSLDDGTLTPLLNDGAGSFTAGDPVHVDREPFGVAGADFNGDKRTDLAVVSNTCLGGTTDCDQGTAGVLLGNGDGTLDTDEALVIEDEREPRSVRGADMDADGDTDLVVAAGLRSHLRVFLNRGARLEKGSLVKVPRFNPGLASELGIADFDGDAAPDVAAGLARVGQFGLTANNGGGALMDAELGDAEGRRPYALATADFDASGSVDIALLSNEPSAGTSVLSIHDNDGSGAFAGMSGRAGPVARTLGDEGRSLVSADVTGDGHPDLLSVHPPDRLLRFANNGDGTFGAAVETTVSGDPSAIETADFDADMVLEIAVAAAAGQEVVILENDGSGVFSEQARIGVGVDPFALDAGDLDGDGDLDLVVANQGFESENATVLLNDGTGAFSDAGSFHARKGTLGTFDGWAGDAIALVDADADGDLDIAMSNLGDFTVSVIRNRVVSPENAEASLGAGGSLSSDGESDGATWSDPVETEVTSPNAGTVRIEEGPHDSDAPRGFRFLGHQINIDAPAASVSDPLIMTFRLDASRIPDDVAPSGVRVFRDDRVLAGCADSSSATPDPCVASRAFPSDGDVEITVRTSAASAWNLGSQLPVEWDIDLDLDTPFGADDLSFVIPQWKIELLFEAVSANNENKDEISARMEPFPQVIAPSTVLGDVALRLRSGQFSPFMLSTGVIEEQLGQFPFLPEFPPYTALGGANAAFDMFIELDVPDAGVLHNEAPLELAGPLDSGWPPDSLETFTFSTDTPLFDQNGNSTGSTVTGAAVTQAAIPPSVERIFADGYEPVQ